jgi:hypothetical protein
LLSLIFGLQGDEVTEYEENSINEELHNLYSLPNIIRMITSRGLS